MSERPSKKKTARDAAGRQPARVLIVDDEAINRGLLDQLLRDEGYLTAVAAGGEAAIEAVHASPPDVILLDAMMPGMDGFETVRRLKADPAARAIPVIMVTALNDRDSKLGALEAGAEEFLVKPVDLADLLVRVRNLLRLKELQDRLAAHNRDLEREVQRRTSELENAYRETVFTLLRVAEHKDEETGHHIRRISYYCRALGQSLQMPGDFLDCIYHASPMHDIGKVAIPDSILLKRGPLDAAEWTVMKTHAAIGARILSKGRSPYTRMGMEIALNHHERWDGSGYPAGLRGEAVPISARIMQICDVYDALRSPRPYKEPFTHERAVSILREGDGRTQPSHFDPRLLAGFFGMVDRFEQIYDRHAD